MHAARCRLEVTAAPMDIIARAMSSRLNEMLRWCHFVHCFTAERKDDTRKAA